VRLELILGEERIEIDLQDPSRGMIVLQGREVPCDWRILPDGRFSIILDGNSYDLAADADGDRVTVSSAERVWTMKVHDPRTFRQESSEDDGRKGLRRLTADMPGKIIRVLVSPGDEVRHDQGLLVIEAMKMQNEIRSPKTGTVREIGVRPGDAVNSGDFLLSID